MTNRYVVVAIVLILSVCSAYISNFYFKLDYVISDKTDAWGQLGDFLGGVINPILSFMSFLFIIKSLNLQNEANLELREEMRNTRKTEKLRSFETQLFHMIGSLRESFESFNVNEVLDAEVLVKFEVGAVISIENEVQRLRAGSSDEVVIGYLEAVDPQDKIYGLTRIFYNMVKVISEKLSDSHGFCLEDRESHYLTLINFTDYALLRLIMMSAQFLDYPSTKYLKNNLEFRSVVYEVGLSFDLY